MAGSARPQSEQSHLRIEHWLWPNYWEAGWDVIRLGLLCPIHHNHQPFLMWWCSTLLHLPCLTGASEFRIWYSTNIIFNKLKNKIQAVQSTEQFKSMCYGHIYCVLTHIRCEFTDLQPSDPSLPGLWWVHWCWPPSPPLRCRALRSCGLCDHSWWILSTMSPHPSSVHDQRSHYTCEREEGMSDGCGGVARGK